jgi:hypothetical protein
MVAVQEGAETTPVSGVRSPPPATSRQLRSKSGKDYSAAATFLWFARLISRTWTWAITVCDVLDVDRGLSPVDGRGV